MKDEDRGRWRWLLVTAVLLTKVLATTTTSSGGGSRKKVLLVNEDDLLSRSASYSLEDFFWTGSGDGPLPPSDKSSHPTIIRTTTVLATVFLDSPSSITPGSPSTDEDCVTECPINPFTGEIDPTRVGEDGDDGDGSIGVSLPDPKYWLLTVLRAPATPLPPSLSRSLAKLYQKAFHRQQQQHLGIITTSTVGHRKKHHTFLNDNGNANSSLQYDSIDNQFYTTSMYEENDLMSNLSSNLQNASTRQEQEVQNLTREAINANSTKFKIKRSINGINIMNDDTQETKDDVGKYNNSSDLVKREAREEIGQPKVEVFLHNLTKGNSSDGDNEIKVIYWVSVGGRPVPAKTAAHDMKLLADAEVVAELGYPITTKAEPYLQSNEDTNGILHANSMRDTYLIIIGAIFAAILILCLVALLAYRLVNRRKSSGVSRTLNASGEKIQPVIIQGVDNKGFLNHEKDKNLVSVIYQGKNDDGKKAHGGKKRIGSASSSSSMSTSDLSQLTETFHQRQKLFEKHMRSEYATVNKRTKSKNRRLRSKKVGASNEHIENDAPEVGSQFVLSSPSSSSVSSCDSVIMRRPQGVISPTSYLSMPSVKSFPRGNAVEPLSRVLEPLSVKHLDVDSDSPVLGGQKNLKRSGDDDARTEKSNLARMGSMNRDPGVIGPIVWDLHRQKIENQSQLSDAADSAIGGNIMKMRQRFSELVDDAFSLFGSGGSSPKSLDPKTIGQQNETMKGPSTITTNKSELRSQSSKERVEDNSRYFEKIDDRPRTGLPPRPPLPQYSANPTLAWGSNTNTPMLRSYSASGTRRPTIDVTLIHSQGMPPEVDPALPLIQAIRKELDMLPGTSDA